MLARRKAGLSREDVAQRLSLTARDIKFIDQQEIHRVVSSTPINRIIREYAILVGLNPAKFSFNVGDLKSESYQKHRMLILSKSFVLLLAMSIVLLMGGFIGWRTYLAVAVPELKIISPAQAYISTEPSVQVVGESSDQAQVFIDGTNVPVDPDGRFESDVILLLGPNNIEVRAINSLGRESDINLTVFYQPVDEQR